MAETELAIFSEEWIEKYFEGLIACGERYHGMAQVDETLNDRPEPILPFVKEYQAGCRDRLPILKINRWLGYIQRTLIERGITTVEAERDWTRPYFRPLDF